MPSLIKRCRGPERGKRLREVRQFPSFTSQREFNRREQPGSIWGIFTSMFNVRCSKRLAWPTPLVWLGRFTFIPALPHHSIAPQCSIVGTPLTGQCMLAGTGIPPRNRAGRTEARAEHMKTRTARVATRLRRREPEPRGLQPGCAGGNQGAQARIRVCRSEFLRGCGPGRLGRGDFEVKRSRLNSLFRIISKLVCQNILFLEEY